MLFLANNYKDLGLYVYESENTGYPGAPSNIESLHYSINHRCAEHQILQEPGFECFWHIAISAIESITPSRRLLQTYTTIQTASCIPYFPVFISPHLFTGNVKRYNTFLLMNHF